MKEKKGEVKSAAGRAGSEIADKGHEETAARSHGESQASTTERTAKVRAAHIVAKRGSTALCKTEESPEVKTAAADAQVKHEMKHQGKKEEAKSFKKEAPRANR